MGKPTQVLSPLSSAQRQLWFLDQWQPESPVYHVPLVLRLMGHLDLGALERSLSEIVRRHEVLRATFVEVDGEPVQLFTPPDSVSLQIEFEDLSGVPASEREHRRETWLWALAQRPFNLQHGLLFRAGVLRLAAEEHVLLLVTHHIVFDGWSFKILQEELSRLYEAFAQGFPSPLSEPVAQYSDYARWEAAWLASEAARRQLSAWKSALDGCPAALSLRADRKCPAVPGLAAASAPIWISREVTEALRALSRREGATLFMTLMAALGVLLSRYSGQKDMLIGSPVANRNSAQWANVIGFFVNTLPFRINLAGEPNFLTLLERVRRSALEVYSNQEMPQERLITELRPDHSANPSPLFQVVFVLQNVPSELHSPCGLELTWSELPTGAAKFDLTIELREGPDGLSGTLDYRSDLFDKDTAARFMRQFHNLLEAICMSPEQPVHLLPLLDPMQLQELRVLGTGAQAEFLPDLCLHQMFEAHAKWMPDVRALEADGESLTYSQLNRHSNQLAHFLREHGVGPGVPVGLCMERSHLMVVGLLAVLKAGGYCVPLDTLAQPGIGYLIELKISLVLTQEKFAARLAEAGLRPVQLDGALAEVEAFDQNNPENQSAPNQAAYVTVAKGSAGAPHGWRHTHRSISNHLLWMQRELGLTANDRILVTWPSDSVQFVSEVLGGLISGGGLVLARPGSEQDSQYLSKVISEQAITIVQLTPSILQGLLDESAFVQCQSLRHVLTTGAPLGIALQERVHENFGATLHSLYALAETAGPVLHWNCRRGTGYETIPLGRPLPNLHVCIVDEHLQPVPLGVPGELCVGGVQVSKDGLDCSAAEHRFMHAQLFGDAPAGMLRTGDHARLRDDGTVEFLGRLAERVLVSGVPTGPAEIEAVLARHPLVRDVAVIARSQPSGPGELIAFVVSNGVDQVTGSALRDFLRERLPEYMVPHTFVFLKRLPVTASGRVDRAALHSFDSFESHQERIAPRTAAERVLAEVWAELLELPLEQLGVMENFFDLGGHSMLAIRVIAKVNQLFNTELKVTILYERPTIAELAEVVQEALYTMFTPEELEQIFGQGEEV